MTQTQLISYLLIASGVLCVGGFIYGIVIGEGRKVKAFPIIGIILLAIYFGMKYFL